jgi:radical SAM superfamily enzyme YgiQ (UPF0313 family)
MSDVLIGQSYYLRFDPKLWTQMQPYAPLGALYAASLLRERGNDVALFDAMLAESEQAWAGALERHRPRIAVLFEDNFNYLSKMCLLRMREAAFTMSAMARERGCTVIVGGSDATDHAAEYLAHGADAVLIGEGDLTLAELLDRIAGRTDTPLSAIAGLAFHRDGRLARLDADGGRALPDPDGLVTTPRRPDIRDLDALPFPAWDLVDVDRYREVWLGRHGEFSMNMATTRGCPFHCNWCAKPIWGQRYNVRSPENVAAEMAWLKETYAPDHIWFADDIMGLKPGWMARFGDAVQAADARIPFKCLGRADLLMRDGDIPALARAGARIVWIGAESGSQRILDAMEKGTTVEQIREVRRRLARHGIRAGFFLQFGYPGETREDIELTLRMVRESLPDDVGVSVSYPLPGTPFHERVREQLGSTRNWRDSDDLAMLYRGPFTTAFYRQLHRVVHAEFRARRAAVELGAAMRHPSRLRPAHLRRAGQMMWNAARLPLERVRLDRLARMPHPAPPPLPPALGREQASTPTPQADA